MRQVQGCSPYHLAQSHGSIDNDTSLQQWSIDLDLSYGIEHVSDCRGCHSSLECGIFLPHHNAVRILEKSALPDY